MRFVAYRHHGVEGSAASRGDGPFHGFAVTDARYPGSLPSLVARGAEALHAAGEAFAAWPDG